MISFSTLLEKNWAQKTFLIINLISCLYLGYTLGQIKNNSEKNTPTAIPTFTSTDINPKIATISVLGIYDHTLYATSTGGPLRLVSDSNTYTPQEDTPFGLYLPENPDLAKTTSEIYDNPCILMASPTGKYVYLKNSPKADNLKEPKCFTSLSEAMDAGYILKE